MLASSAMSRTTVLAKPWRATSRVAASTIWARRRSTRSASPTRERGLVPVFAAVTFAIAASLSP